MDNSFNKIETTINIAAVLLKNQNFNHLIILKDFIMFIPNPNQIKEVLSKAVQEVVNDCPETTRWLLKHPHCLEPEIDVQEVIHQEISNKFIALGLPVEKFSFNSEGNLVLSEPLKQAVLNYANSCDFSYDIHLILFLLKAPYLETG